MWDTDSTESVLTQRSFFIKFISNDQNIGNISQSIPQSSEHQGHICITVVVRAINPRSMNRIRSVTETDYIAVNVKTLSSVEFKSQSMKRASASVYPSSSETWSIHRAQNTRRDILKHRRSKQNKQKAHVNMQVFKYIKLWGTTQGPCHRWNSVRRHTASNEALMKCWTWFHQVG